MKRIYTLFILICFVLSAKAQSIAGGDIQISKQSISISDNNMLLVGMDITIPAEMKIPSDLMLKLTPMLLNQVENANKTLPPVVVYGRKRAIVNEREGSVPEEAFEVLRREDKKEQTINYTARIPFESWMHESQLELSAYLYGCANCLKQEEHAFVMPVSLVRYAIQPSIAFVTPEVETVKARAEEGRAYLDFPVNQVVIYPEYRNNSEELKKIISTIELVKNDKNTQITGIEIKGFASPEGSYKSNARLAQGRAEALKDYVQGLYHFEKDLIKVTSVPEDWAGLRYFVDNNDFKNKNEMLIIIDDETLDYDARELRLRTIDCGKAYATLLKECYPALRHSDYKVQYVVRGFTVDEAREILTKRPQQLSLNEMFQVAQSYESGSEEFNEVFEVAVRMFPDDPTANINAAAIELQLGNWKQAEKYLLKSDPQAGTTKNNEGVLWMMQGQLDKAEALFNEAKALGSAEAAKNLEEISKKRRDNALYGK